MNSQSSALHMFIDKLISKIKSLFGSKGPDDENGPGSRKVQLVPIYARKK